MKISVWSDFACPFCFMGQARLDKALETFEHAKEVEVEYKSFLLMPEVEYVPGQSYAEAFANLKGVPLDRAKAMLRQATSMGRESGVEINYDTAKLTSTNDAHRVFQYAKDQGKGLEFFKRFYAAHLSEGEVLSDIDTIVRLAEEVGLDGETVRRIVENNEYTDQVIKDVEESRHIGVQGVPFYVIDNKYALSGAQPVEVFSQALEKAWAERQ